MRPIPASPPRAMVMNDAPQPVEPHVFIRGNPGRPGKAVPRRFLKVLSGPDRRRFRKGAAGSSWPRRSPTPDNPLTARVLVNRVWHWHFGKGLVDDAQRLRPAQRPADASRAARLPGRPSSWPTAGRSRRCTGGSCSPAPISSRATRGPMRPERDPENRLLWRFNRQRLDFESMRDSVLAVSGALDPTIGGPPVADRRAALLAPADLYGFIDRQNLDGRLPDLRLRRARRHQPPAVRDDGAAAGPLPDEQPVPARAGATAGRRDSAGSRLAPERGDRGRGVRLLYRRVLGRLARARRARAGGRLPPPAVWPPAAADVWQTGQTQPPPSRSSRPGSSWPGVAADQRIHVCRLIERPVQSGRPTEATVDVAPLHPDCEDAVMTRRELLCRSGMGMGALALGSLLSDAGLLSSAAACAATTRPPSAASGSIRLEPARAQAAAPAGPGQAGRPPVHERRAVARRHVRPQADARRSTTASRCRPTCPPSARPARPSARPSSSRSTARAASRSASCSPTRPR